MGDGCINRTALFISVLALCPIFLLAIVLNMKVCGLFMSICVSVGVLAGKYSREVNEQKVSDDGENAVEFRIAKLNQVWEKANRVSKRRVSGDTFS